MQKILWIFNIVLFSITCNIAQKTISKTDFETLVDFANCKYVMAFINEHDNDKTNNFQYYQKNIEPKLKAVSLDNSNKVLIYKELHKLLKDNFPAQELAEKINKRKNKYNDYSDNISLINSLSTTHWKNIDLKEISENIQNDLLSKYNYAKKNSESSNSFTKEKGVEKQKNQSSTQEKELQANSNQLPNQKFDSKILDIHKSIQSIAMVIFIVIFVVVLGFVLLFYFFAANYIKRVTEKSNRLEQKFVTKSEFIYGGNSKELSNFENKLEKLERTISELKIELNKNFKPVDSENQALYFKSNKNSAPSNEIFFKTKNGKILQEELPTSLESSFKLFNINNNEANFEYCGGIVNSDFFDDVCTFQNNPLEVVNKTKIETTAPGRVKKDNNGNWIVEKPAKIKFL